MTRLLVLVLLLVASAGAGLAGPPQSLKGTKQSPGVVVNGIWYEYDIQKE